MGAPSDPRPPVDVVVPFRGDQTGLDAVLDRLGKLVLRADDSLVVVDNGGRRRSGRAPTATVIRAAGRATPGFARNAGAARGHAPWLVFLDADTTPAPDLLDRYFEPPPAPDTALMSGAVIDEPVAADAPVAARYAHLRELTSQGRTLGLGAWAYPKSANLACRRAAFEQAGGFREELRAGEDADLAYRLRGAGWRTEHRPRAVALHHSRPSVASLVRQKLIWGAGGADLNRLHPGAAPPRRRPGLIWWAVRACVTGVRRARRTGERDEAYWAMLEALEVLVLEFGRSLPNERPLTAGVWWRAAQRLFEPGERRRD